MKNLYQHYQLKPSASARKACFRVLKEIDKAEALAPLDKTNYLALHIFLHEPLKKYYDHHIQRKALSKSVLHKFLGRVDRIQHIPPDALPLNRNLQWGYFIAKCLPGIILRALSLDFFFHNLLNRFSEQNRAMDEYMYFRAALFKFIFTYGFPIFLYTQDQRFLIALIAIFLFRLWFSYYHERLEYTTYIVKEWRESLWPA